MTSKTVNRLTLAATLAMFVAAMAVLYHQLEATRLVDIVARLAAIPDHALASAVVLTAASYLVLTGYDFLALVYTGRKLRVRDVLFASFTAFAFSNSIGFSLVSGGSIRYRLYSSLGLGAVEIGEIVVFCTLSYALGVCMDAGLLLILDSARMAGVLHVPVWLAVILGAGLTAIPASYLVAALVRRRPIRLGTYWLRLPSFRLGVAQLALASLDQLVAGSVVYVLLTPGQDISLLGFLSVYIVAAPASVVSLVPGGLGVLETLIVVLLTQTPKGAVLGALLAYRFIYFLLPLGLAVAGLALLQIRRTGADLGWLGGMLGGRAANAARSRAGEGRAGRQSHDPSTT